MAINSFLRRASSIPLSIRSIRSMILYQRDTVVRNVENRSRGGVVGGQFVRYMTGSACKAAPPKEISLGDGSFVLKDGLCRGSPTLLKKCEHEIIKVDVTAYQNVMDYYDVECLEQDGDIMYRLEQWDVDEMKQDCPDEVVDVNPCLRLQVKIYHGYMHRQCISFDVLAFPDHKIWIRQMYASVLVRDRKKFTQPHLEGFEDFLKIRGIGPDNMKSYFDSLSEPRQLGSN